MPSNHISHCVAAQVFVHGTGQLHTKVLSINNLNFYSGSVITMSESTDKFSVSLMNFSSQKMQLEIKTDALDEYFRISKITVFVKPVASGYPM